jgi:DNA modification methylase
MDIKIINGNNIDILKTYPDNYFDAVVTDPPYGLGKEPNAEALMKDWIEHGYHEILGSGFMGKEWDAFVPQPVFWKEVYRVLKHGGHVLSFFGTRTYDWGVMSMRFAGFEVRDCIQWLYGSGFPKSHNISKAIDKKGDRTNDKDIDFVNWLKDKNSLSMQEIDKLLGTKSQAFHYFANSDSNRQIPSNEHFKILKEVLNLDDRYDSFIEEKNKELKDIREVIGYEKSIKTWNIPYEKPILGDSITDAAKQWDGWGTALKPANEPIVLARKPLEKGLSIAENILKWGVGGINIDASRISTNGEKINIGFSGKILDDTNGWNSNNIERTPYDSTQGRFPANIILTHHEDCECKGTKKVKPSNGSGKASEKGGGFSKGMFGNGTSDNIGGGFTDADGNETIEDWDCHEDCPIRILDEQSGISKTGDIKPYKSNSNSTIYGGGKGYNTEIRNTNFKGDKGGASRFFYVAKASKSERNKGLDDFEEKPLAFSNQAKAELKRGNLEFNGNGIIGEGIVGHGNKINMLKNFHPTVKPIKLMQYLVKMITPPNGIVLDPFCGSGTTGVACKLDGFSFVGLEQDPEYTKIAEARIENYIDKENPNNKKDQLSLF